MAISVCQLLGHSEISVSWDFVHFVHFVVPSGKLLWPSFHYATVWSNVILPNTYEYISLKVGPKSSIYQVLISEHANTANQLSEDIYLWMFLLLETGSICWMFLTTTDKMSQVIALLSAFSLIKCYLISVHIQHDSLWYTVISPDIASDSLSHFDALCKGGSHTADI